MEKIKFLSDGKSTFNYCMIIFYCSSSTMTSQRWMLSLLILGSSAIALVSAARLSKQESLRSALDAVARKQRSLDTADSPEYYNDLHSFKYHGGDADRKFDRDFDADDEEIEFLPGKNNLLTEKIDLVYKKKPNE